jgi:hypothetical protein
MHGVSILALSFPFVYFEQHNTYGRCVVGVKRVSFLERSFFAVFHSNKYIWTVDIARRNACKSSYKMTVIVVRI